jgi:hypothetical protein
VNPSNEQGDLLSSASDAIARGVKRATTFLGASAVLTGAAWLGCATNDSSGDVADAGAADVTADIALPVDSAPPPKDTAAPDTAQPADAGADVPEQPFDASGIVCGQVTCAPGQPCCATSADGGAMFACGSGTCAPGTFTVACDDPYDCGDAGTFCCATLATGPGQPNNCPATALNAACANACATNIALQCASVSTVRLCHAAADCASDTNFPHCCEFSQGASTASFCADDLIGAFAIHCWP